MFRNKNLSFIVILNLSFICLISIFTEILILNLEYFTFIFIIKNSLVLLFSTLIP
jgi:hypothetical protein